MRGYQFLSKESRLVDFIVYLINNRIIEIKQDRVHVLVNGQSRYMTSIDDFNTCYDLLNKIDSELRIAHEEFDIEISEKKQEIIKLKDLFVNKTL
jgi:hypothetical protein